MKGIFTISLDFELHWGGFDKWHLRKPTDAANDNSTFSYEKYFYNTRETIPRMLELFNDYEVHVTWATVGMLFHGSRDALLKNAPPLKPSYDNAKLSAYHYIETVGIGADENQDIFHFAPSLIQQIIETPNQELATHTFAHYYCNEAGQTVDQFRDDLKAAQRAASNFGKKLRSLVFPRNQFNDHYLRVCFEEGITSVRSNPLDWFWHIESTIAESKWKRLNRGLDAYIPLGKKNTYRLSSVSYREGYPVCLPASRLLRPYDPAEFFLNHMKLARIMAEMKRAAANGEVYHLWWHPHNFGRHPRESIQGLEKILECYAYCRKHWQMESLSMSELADTLRNEQ